MMFPRWGLFLDPDSGLNGMIADLQPVCNRKETWTFVRVSHWDLGISCYHGSISIWHTWSLSYSWNISSLGYQDTKHTGFPLRWLLAFQYLLLTGHAMLGCPRLTPWGLWVTSTDSSLRYFIVSWFLISSRCGWILHLFLHPRSFLELQSWIIRSSTYPLTCQIASEMHLFKTYVSDITHPHVLFSQTSLLWSCQLCSSIP